MGQMYITASPETQQAIAKTVKSAADTAKQHLSELKKTIGEESSELTKDMATGAALGAVGGAVLLPYPLPISMGIGTGLGLGAGTAKYVTDKAVCAFKKMIEFVKEHPEALVAQAKTK